MASEVFRIIKVLRKTVGASEKQMLRVLGLPLFSRRDRGVSEDRPGRAGACRPTAGASWIHRPSGRVLRIKNREAVPGENREILTLKGLERSRAKKGDLLLSSAGSGFFPEQEGCFLLMPPEDQGQTTGGREALSARLRIDGERERKRERESEREAKPEALSFRLEQTDDPGVRVRKYVLLKEGRLRLTLEEPYPLDIGRRYRMGEFLLRCLAPGKSIRVREKVRRKISGESPGAGGLRLFKELKPKREDLWEEALRGKGFLYASSERKQWYGKNYSSFFDGEEVADCTGKIQDGGKGNSASGQGSRRAPPRGIPAFLPLSGGFAEYSSGKDDGGENPDKKRFVLFFARPGKSFSFDPGDL